jgi:hypothetical protein
MIEQESLGLLKFRNLELIKSMNGDVPNSEILSEWNKQFGADHASFLLYQAILASPEQKNFIEFVYHHKLEQTKTEVKNPIEILVISSSNEKLAKWGAHVDVIKTWLEELGLSAEELVTFSDNSLIENARLIGEAIQASHSKKIIISFGRGSLEMSLLAKMNEKNKIYDLHSVASWINMAGSVSGSIEADQILDGRMSRLTSRLKSILKKDYRAQLAWASRKNPVWRSGFSNLKQSINISVLPICLEKHISAYYKSSYLKLKAFGTNDSQNLLVDQIIRPGFIYPLWRKAVIDDIDSVKQDFIRIVLAVETILNQRLGLDFLKEPNDLSFERPLSLQVEAPLELED